MSTKDYQDGLEGKNLHNLITSPGAENRKDYYRGEEARLRIKAEKESRESSSSSSLSSNDSDSDSSSDSGSNSEDDTPIMIIVIPISLILFVILSVFIQIVLFSPYISIIGNIAILVMWTICYKWWIRTRNAIPDERSEYKTLPPFVSIVSVFIPLMSVFALLVSISVICGFIVPDPRFASFDLFMHRFEQNK